MSEIRSVILAQRGVARLDADYYREKKPQEIKLNNDLAHTLLTDFETRNKQHLLF